MKLTIITAIAVALLSACAANPQPAPIVTPATNGGKAFLDEYLKGITGGAPEQSPAPQHWEDLLIPPGVDRPTVPNAAK